MVHTSDIGQATGPDFEQEGLDPATSGAGAYNAVHTLAMEFWHAPDAFSDTT